MAKDTVKKSVNNSRDVNTRALNMDEASRANAVKGRALRSRRFTRFVTSERGMALMRTGIWSALALVMISSFVMSQLFPDSGWFVSFWKQFQGHTVNSYFSQRFGNGRDNEIRSFWYFDVFGYLKNVGGNNHYIGDLFGTNSQFAQFFPAEYNVLTVLILIVNMILLPFYLGQFVLRFLMMINLYTFSILGLTSKFPLWGVSQFILEFEVPLIPYP